MKAKDKESYSDVLIDSFQYAILHAGAVGGGEKLRRSRARLSEYVTKLETTLHMFTKLQYPTSVGQPGDGERLDAEVAIRAARDLLAGT